MQYKSPIRLFNSLHISVENVVSNADLLRLKKQIVIEFAMVSNGIITVENINFSKDEILQMIEADNFISNLVFHQKIYAQPTLLKLLEKNKLDSYFKQYYNWKNFYTDENFKKFISPYFATTFNITVRNLFNESNFTSLIEWMDYKKMIEINDYEIAFDTVRKYLQSCIKNFKNTNTETLKTDSDFEHWLTLDWPNFINQLPDEMIDLIEKFIDAGITFTVNNYSNNVALSIATNKQLAKINYCNQKQIELITSNGSYYQNERVEQWNKKYNLLETYIYNPLNNLRTSITVKITGKTSGWLYQIVYFLLLMIFYITLFCSVAFLSILLN